MPGSRRHPIAADRPAGLSYALSYEIEPRPRLAVELAFDVGDWTETRLRLPEKGDADDRRWELISDIEVAGAGIEARADAQVWLKHAPNARIQVRYAVADGYERTDPDPYRPRLSRHSALFIGERVFGLPERWVGNDGHVAWRRYPSGWSVGATVQASQSNRIRDLLEGVFYGGARGQIEGARLLGQHQLAFVALGGPTAAEAEVRLLAERILPAAEAFWRSPHGLRTLVVASVAPQTLTAQAVGRVFDGAVLFLLDPTAAPRTLDFLVAHELTHAWCPGRLMSTARVTPSDYWFSEGVTDSFAARTLVLSGLWSAPEFAQHLNRRLRRYAGSRYRTEPLANVLAGRGADSAAVRHLYDRGCLLATKWGLEIWDDSAAAPGVREAAIRALRSDAAAKDDGAAKRFLSELAAIHPGDLAGDVARHIEAGDPIALPTPPASRLVALSTRRSPIFGPGFERWRRDDGLWEVSAVDAGSGAEVAGLKPGDVLRAVRRASHAADARVEVMFADRDAGEPPTSFAPQRKREVLAQSLEILELETRTESATAGQCLVTY